jgi:hypothetical protein
MVYRSERWRERFFESAIQESSVPLERTKAEVLTG